MPLTLPVISFATDRAKAAALDLNEELRRSLGDQLPNLPKMAGSKGVPITVATIVLALITSGAVAKALDCVKAWIEKDPTDRELRVTGNVGDKPVDIRIDATNIDDHEVHKIIQSLAGNAAATKAKGE